MPKEVKASHHRNRSTSSAMAASSSTRSAATWTPQDDETLINARASGLNWQPIATKHFPSKTANACRKRHERLMERRNAEDWDGVKLEILAREYMNLRREIWTPLAERVGEKWTIVEAKCMEKGIKNIQAAARSAMRKERGNDESGDSGIGDSGAENEIDDGHSDAPQPALRVQPVYHPHPDSRAGPSIQSLLSPSPGQPMRQ